jgi:hypothetical protein
MYELVELKNVEETKHLLPNLRVMARALFGDEAYHTPKAPRQADWATDKSKIGDGLLWLPWSRQLWLIELEWKEGSNFFDQSRAFAEGKVDRDKLRAQLEEILKQFSDVLNQAGSALKEGIITRNIIEETLKNHVEGGRLCPHGWVILGHSGNREKLKHDYEKELRSRFGGDKHYILSMARMFVGGFSSYILLEQYCSKGCQRLLKVEPSILVPAVSGTPVEVTSPGDVISESPPQGPQKPTRFGEGDVPGGRAAEVLAYLKNINPELNPEDVKFRIQVDDKHRHDFEIDWNYQGPQLMVFSKRGIRQKPSTAAKEVFGDLLAEKVRNISRKIGAFVDYSKTPPIEISSLTSIERHFWRTKKEVDTSEFLDEKGRLYLHSTDPRRRKKISDNIINRKELWEVFIEKKRMTSEEFKRFSSFRPKAIAGFMRFLIENCLARRAGNVFILNEAVIPEIRKLLSKSED